MPDSQPLRFWQKAAVGLLLFGTPGFGFVAPVHGAPDPDASLSGKVYGPVKDSLYIFLSGAKVVAINQRTNEKFETNVNPETREYQFPNLEPGEYYLVACASSEYKPDF